MLRRLSARIAAIPLARPFVFWAGDLNGHLDLSIRAGRADRHGQVQNAIWPDLRMNDDAAHVGPPLLS
jgi:hypothetical protein